MHTLSHATPPAVAGGSAGHRHWHEGLELSRRSDWQGAARAFGRATRAAPRDQLYWFNLANAQRRAGALPRAVAAARRGLQLQPRDAIGLRLLGDCLAQLHRYAEAVDVLATLEAQGHAEPEAMVQRAQMLQMLQRPCEAVDLLLRALSMKPGLLAAHAVLADALRDQGLKREAVECMKTVLALQPDHLEAMSHLSFEKRHVCDWTDFDSDLQQLEETLVTAPHGLARVAASFSLLSLPLDPALHLVAARGEALALAVGVTELPPVQPRAHAGRRVRVGWLSHDFRQHPVSQLLVELLEQLDRSRFEVWLYSTSADDGSALRRRVVAAADQFIDLRGSSDQQAAERIRNDGISLLVDLMGHTRHHRHGILARRPAPLQVAYLGFPGSTGAPCIDYLVGDPLVTPLALAPLYSEKLAQMPTTFQPNGRWRPLPRPAQPMQRSAAGLPEEAFVMCAFNHTYKILPEAFDTWCTLLCDLPHAVLWLKETNPQLRHNVLLEAAARGVDASRIVFAPPVSYADHFSRLALADVFVDTWPYNAHTTAADALWAGVPVVTVYGNSFASRVAASVLNAAGLAELACATPHDYRCAITALAQDPSLLATYRDHLTTQRLDLPLFDSSGYVREFESLLGRMLARWRAGLAPEHLPADAEP